MYEPVSNEIGKARDVRDRLNVVGPLAVAVPGALAAWCETLERYGTLSLAEVLQPAIRLAARGFVVSPYLSDCAGDCAADLAGDPGLSALFLPGGEAIRAGSRLVQEDYARTLSLIAEQGPSALYGGELGGTLARFMADKGGLIDEKDLADYRVVTREPVRGTYRGYEIVGPPPPASSAAPPPGPPPTTPTTTSPPCSESPPPPTPKPRRS